jgi:hypothetical protein
MANHPSNSRVQQEIGKELVNSFSSKLGVKLEEERELLLGSACKVVIDGYSKDPPIICEAWVHCGKPKGGQPSKIMEDALKLLFTEKCLKKEHTKILLFCDEHSRKYFTGKSWQAKCLLGCGIKTEVYPLTEEQEQRLKEAKKLQQTPK